MDTDVLCVQKSDKLKSNKNMSSNFEKLKLQKNHLAEEDGFSPEVWELFKRFDAGDPSVVEVAPPLTPGIKSAEVGPDDKGKTFLTFGLGGCSGIFIFTEQKDGLRNAVLAHYSELKTTVAVDEIHKELRRQPKMKKAVIKQAILMVPGIRVWDSSAGKEVLKAAETKFADKIAEAIRLELGARVDIKLEPYPEEQRNNEKDFGVFVAHIPPAGEKAVSYRTWFGSGELGAKL